jgi:transposase-like protein
MFILQKQRKSHVAKWFFKMALAPSHEEVRVKIVFPKAKTLPKWP